ncbi:MAG TPA: hypothetical protein VEY91_10630 [Candidatus Limnocylindria bacterium]|nr:hypothetical protein [Candidatus Limnocylindria bacterium]
MTGGAVLLVAAWSAVHTVLAVDRAPHETAAAVATACAAPGRPLIGELFYDAIGDDTGLEFVELYNPTETPAALAGMRLEAGDGSGPGRWTSRWTGGATDTVPARGRFVIGGARVVPAPQAIVTLDLQNGPDAVRLVWPDGRSEVLGFGAHEFPEYVCGDPAPDVPSGSSLARMPDRSDLGSNALDFQAASPSPGRANRPDRDAALPSGSLVIAPEQPAPGTRPRLSGAIANRGASAWSAGELVLIGREREAETWRERFAIALDLAPSPGDTLPFAIDFDAGSVGKRLLEVRLALPGDQAPENDVDSLRYRVGRGPLMVTEIQFHPVAGEGEWVEVRNQSSTPLDPTAFRLADRGTGVGVPSDGAGEIEPDSLVVFAEDPAALRLRFSGLDARRIWLVRPWATLNNSNDTTGVADAVVVRESDGTLSERVAYSAAGVPAGVPLERRGEDWWPATAPEGTPLSPPRTFAAQAARFDVSPRRIGAGRFAVRLSWALPWERARVAVELYDLAGRRLQSIMADGLAPGRSERNWSADATPPGLYLLVLRARPEHGPEAMTATQPLRVEGAAR